MDMTSEGLGELFEGNMRWKVSACVDGGKSEPSWREKNFRNIHQGGGSQKTIHLKS
jgi:hypothetical protein